MEHSNIFMINKKLDLNYDSKYTGYTEYKGFMIKNDLVKSSVDQFYNSINISFHIFSENYLNINTLEQNLEELDQLLKDFNLLIQKQELLQIDNENDIITNCKLIEYVFKKIMYYYLEQCVPVDNIIAKGKINGLLCEIFIKYNHIFTTNPLKNILIDIKKYMISRCLFLSINHGCLISWLTFATLCPEIINNDSYLIINTNGLLYTSINWDYVNNKKSLEPQLKIFYRYYLNPVQTTHIKMYDYNGYKLQISYV